MSCGARASLRFAVVLGACLAAAPVARAQSALAGATVDPTKLPPKAHLTLRPSPGLEEVAAKVARVLTLRAGAVVDVGDPPPPGLLEAVPAGHVALALAGDQVQLVFGGALGRSFEAFVKLGPGDAGPDVRAVALAVEALRDQAIEAHGTAELPAAPPAAGPAVSARPTAMARANAPARDDGIETYAHVEDGFLEPVRPLFYVRAFGGASTRSEVPQMGIGTGGGMCVLGQCLLLTIEYPLPLIGEAVAHDVRYRYTTFTAGFLSRPWQLGRLLPAASIGFLSRVGRFDQDMGLPGAHGLQTDLGVRATVEAGYQVLESLDLVAELGLDYALDRWQLGHGAAVAYRGDRASPWFQAAVRVMPY